MAVTSEAAGSGSGAGSRGGAVGDAVRPAAAASAEPGAASAASRIPLREVVWRPCYRVIPSRYPPIDLFERVAPPEDWDALIELESQTNTRLRDEIGEIRLVPPEDRVVGPGAGYIMAAFTHVAPEGGRFHDGSYGAYYTARDRDTAIAESMWRRALFLARTSEPPMHLDMRLLEADLAGELHDLRGMAATLPEVYDPDDYRASQALARDLRRQGSPGIAYDSVRAPGGECAAVFRPRLLSRCRETRHLTYVWDGRRIAHVYEKRPYRRGVKRRAGGR
ncbi:MAG TPA: RES family NAD+ phosphorylase [Longimicrobiales bacterium]